MIRGKKIVVVMPAYNAERTLERTYRAMAPGIVDEVVLVDDGSTDQTSAVAQRLGILCYRHTTNRGYGANQKTCYQAALRLGADVVVMLHPDGQHPPELIPALMAPVLAGTAHIALGSRILGGRALRDGMPLHRYLSNRAWTWGQNVALGQRLSEYHSGFRAFSRQFLLSLPLLENTDDFLFDNQVMIQALYFGYDIAETAVPARFPPDASSISVWRGIWYGAGVVLATCRYLLHRAGFAHFRIFDPNGRRLDE